MPSIEDVIGRALRDGSQHNALDFVAHLRASGIPLAESDTYWDVKYDGRSVCFLWVDGADQQPGPWTIWSDQEPGTWAAWSDEGEAAERTDFPIDERMKNVAWANVNRCASCGGDCSPGRRKVVLGRAFDGLCGSAMAFVNPDAEALACAKLMIDMRMRDIRGEMAQ